MPLRKKGCETGFEQRRICPSERKIKAGTRRVGPRPAKRSLQSRNGQKCEKCGLDLTDRSEWLGHHTFAGLWQLDDELTNTAPFSEYNTTPNNNDRIRFAQNGILRRTYLDLSPGGATWFANPRENPVPTDTGVTAEFIHRGVWADVLNEIEAVMGVLQSRFWDDRLIFTTGYREDKLTTNRATQGGEDFPGSINFLRLKPHTIFEKDRENVFKGDTTTFGGFFSVLPWLGLTFNTSEISSLKEITRQVVISLPNQQHSGEEDLLPYGTNSPDTVQRYIFQRQRQKWTLRVSFGF